jgi:hypothetical protein
MKPLKRLLFGRLSLTPVLSRWERENHRQTVREANNDINS